jgi:tRNA 2-thiouridine synthesizing protein A
MATAKPDWPCIHEFDGGEKECGELLLDLRLYFDPLEPGARVCVTANDPGAWIDLPAWCRVTGHRLLDKVHPFYLIEKKSI